MYKGKMAIVKETLSDYKEDYQKASIFLTEIKNDPPNEPCRSLYAAKELLLGMQKNLENVLALILAEEAEDGKQEFRYKVLLANVHKDLGYIYNKTKEPTLSEKHFRRSIELIESHKMHPEAVIPYIIALNGLGIVLGVAKKTHEAMELLKLSEQMYIDFKADGNAEAMSIIDLFGTIEGIEKCKRSDALEKIYTTCTFAIAQVYVQMNEWEKSALYFHKSLRHLNSYDLYDPIEFAVTASNLAKVFLKQYFFKEARHYLAAASWMMAKYEAEMITPEMSESNIKNVKETFKRHHADLARSWAIYGLVLLCTSKIYISNNKVDGESVNGERFSRKFVDSNDFRLPNLQLDVYENRVSTEYCLNLDDAKLIFPFVVNWLDQAKSYYYKFDIKPTEYAGIIKDYAKLYEMMAFFEKNPINKVKMLKRCAIYYEKLIDDINPTDYLMICRECWHGAGEAYSMILSIFRDQKNPSTSLIEKMNQVSKKTIKYFVQLIKSYMENDCITLKPNLSTEEIHQVLCNYYYLGTLYYKMRTPDPSLQLESMMNSYKYMKRFIDACEKYKEAAETLKNEIRISQDLVDQLPLKIEIYRALTDFGDISFE